MTLTIDKKLTVDEFECLLALPENADRLLELIDGEVVEKMPTEEHGIIAGNIIFALRGYVQQHQSGRVGTEVRHRMPSDNFNSRLPDVSYSTARRPVITKGSVPEMADLAVEIQSPNDSVKQMRVAAAYYVEHGAQLVWLVYPSKRIVEVLYADGEADIFRDGEVLSGEAVLPGFTLPVADIFDDPFGT